MKKALVLGSIAVVGLVVGAILATFVWDSGDGLSRVALGNFNIRTANAEGQPLMSRRAVEATARKAIEARLPETVSSKDLAQIEGRAIRASDLQLVDSAFAPEAIEITSSVVNFTFTSSSPRSVWVLIFRAQPVKMPDWGIDDGVVEAQIVVNDETGGMEASNILRYNPNAES